MRSSHTERGDAITVSAERLDGVVRLVVQDTGKGMAFDAQARAFDSFQSGDRQGAGLGLALVRSFVEMHGGWVALASEPGRGVTVTCHLPARRRNRLAPHPRNAKPLKKPPKDGLD